MSLRIFGLTPCNSTFLQRFPRRFIYAIISAEELLTMPRLLAFDWDAREIRFVLANTDRQKVSVLKIGSVQLEETDSSSLNDEGAEKVGAALGLLLRQHHVSNVPALVALSRGNVELTPLSLPRASDAELPDLISLQILRESPQYIEGSPLDFLSLSTNPAEERRILAAHLSRSEMTAMRSVCRKAGKRLLRLELASAAVAELYLNQDVSDSAAPTLCVAFGPDEINFAVVFEGQIHALRSSKLPVLESAEETVKRTVAEINRTFFVGVPELLVNTIQKIVLFGSAQEWKPYIELLNAVYEEGEQAPVEIVNPFTLSNVRCEEPPIGASRFAPLLGMLLNEQRQRRPSIDFLRPKEKPKPINTARYAVFAAVLLAICVYGLHIMNQRVLDAMRKDVAALQEKYSTTSAMYAQLQPPYGVLSIAKAWESGCSNWLDELREISLLFPASQDLVVTEMTLTSGPINRNPNYAGMIQFSGIVKDSTVLRRLENSLKQKGFYLMRMPALNANPSGGGFAYQFKDATIYCGHRQNYATYLKSLSPEQQADSNQWPEFYPKGAQQ